MRNLLTQAGNHSLNLAYPTASPEKEEGFKARMSFNHSSL